MCYTQLFNLLCEKADDVYGGRLPVHVRCLIDECANIGQIPKLEKLVATIRSREISACLVLQAQSQLKAIYKAVSYTHLDVYKRQVNGNAVPDLILYHQHTDLFQLLSQLLNVIADNAVIECAVKENLRCLP